MRILYFTRDYTPHDHRFLSALAESGQETCYLRLERAGRQVEDRPLPAQVTQVAWRGGQRPFAWRELPSAALALRRVLREVKPDVVHAGPLQTCALIAGLAGARPLVSMSWGSDILKDAHASRWMERATRFALRRSDVLVGDCQAVSQAAQGFGFPAENIVLFPWGVDLETFKPVPEGEELLSELRARLGWQDCFVALSLRSWEPIYGVDVVVNAFARAAAVEPRLRLILLGGGSLAGQIQRLLHEHQLHDRVHLGGQVGQARLPEVYRAADLYVSASHSDGSSVSLMEALASGLPAFVSDIPGNREWVGTEEAGVKGEAGTEGAAGWLFPDGDANALAEGMLRAAADPSGLARMRLAARALAERRADWRENFQQLLAAYALAVRLRKGQGR